MQYSNRKADNKKIFYAVVAVCIAAIALTSFIAVSQKNGEKNAGGKKENTVISDKSDSYNDSTGNNETENAANAGETEATPTENKAENVPYEEPENKPTEAKVERTFVMPVKGEIIKQFSEETLQYDKTFGDMRLHKATDIACKENAQIVSVSNGTVTDVRESAEYNKIVTIDHGDGYTVEYCGLGTTAVKKGETVGAGTVIGTAKNPPCECLDECHIHIVCLKNGIAFDPLSLYKSNN